MRVQVVNNLPQVEVTYSAICTSFLLICFQQPVVAHLIVDFVPNSQSFDLQIVGINVANLDRMTRLGPLGGVHDETGASLDETSIHSGRPHPDRT